MQDLTGLDKELRARVVAAEFMGRVQLAGLSFEEVKAAMHVLTKERKQEAIDFRSDVLRAFPLDESTDLQSDA